MRLVLPKKINDVQGSIKNFHLDGILCTGWALTFCQHAPYPTDRPISLV